MKKSKKPSTSPAVPASQVVAKKRPPYFPVLLFLVVVTTALIILEIFARTMVYGQGLYLKQIDEPHYSKLFQQDPPYQFQKNFYQDAISYGWAQTPDNEGVFRGFSYPTAEFRTPVKINSQGFRGDEQSVPEDRLRVAVLGDSFVQALQVREEETLSRVLERELTGGGVAARAYNFGISSTGTAHQYRLFFGEVLKVRPNAVVLMFFPNDLRDSSPDYAHEDDSLIPAFSTAEDGKIIVDDFTGTPGRQTISYAFPVAEGKGYWQDVASDLKVFSENFKAAVFPKFLFFFIKERFGPKHDYDAPFDVYKKEYPEPLKESLRITAGLIRQIDAYCKTQGIKFVVVLVPAKEQVHPEIWSQYVDARKEILNSNDFDLGMPNVVIKGALEGSDVPVLDLLPAFKEAAGQDSLYYKKDLHFNVKGHEKAGRLVAEFLKK